MGTNKHFSAVPVGTVDLNKPMSFSTVLPQDAAFVNTSEVELASGGLLVHTDFTFTTDLALNGGNFDINNKVVTVDGELKGEGGSWSNGPINLSATGSVSPGNEVGTLGGGALVLQDGATYSWDMQAS